MRVLIVAAHPDDELLGVGGTLARHVRADDEVAVVIVSEGATSRYPSGSEHGLEQDAREAARTLGVAEPTFLALPDQRLDGRPIVDVIRPIEEIVQRLRPAVVYTHHGGDLNRDHRVVAEAVQVACRPVGRAAPRRLYAFETPSSTEWAVPSAADAFLPSHFVDVSATLEDKLRALQCYRTELRPAPHPRSIESLRARAAYWGQQVGVACAEAFVVLRQIE